MTPTPIRPARRARGVSLIEALVALAVMAFGMLGMVGIQATLRGNADVAKQRSEAVRIGQEQLETWRAFSVLGATAGHTQLYSGIADVPAANVVGYTTNTTFTLTGTVVDSVPVGSKTLVVDVQWTDRSGVVQGVRLSSLVAGIAPELAATLVTRSQGAPTRNPYGRDRGIPTIARDFGDGTSGFKPPQPPGGTVAWRFDNVTGLITLCSTAVASTAAIASSADFWGCGATPHRLVAGFVRFATGAAAPLPADVVDPAGPAFPAVEVEVDRTAPAALTVGCFEEPVFGTALAYLCAVPVAAPELRWSGSIRLADPPLPIAPTIADDDAATFKVCRYGAAASFVDIKSALVNQNFVVIRAGLGGGTAFACPAGPTWPHQPAT